MRSRLTSLLFIIAALVPIDLLAADASAEKGYSSINPALMGLTSIALVLMVAIGFLAYVLKQLAFVYRDKFRKERASDTGVKAGILLLIGLIGASTSFAQEAETLEAPVATAAALYINGIPRADFYAISGIILFELIVILALLSMVYHMVRVLGNIPEKKPLVDRIMAINLLDYFNKSVAVEKEQTIVLDHEYDGIHELDNSLPPWWKWGFVMTIVFAFGYMWYYHMADGPSQIDEYAAAVAKGEQEKLAYLAKAGNSVDENNVTLIQDAGQLADAQILFKNTCAACHREDGGGNVGPNLTDNYWLHGGSLKDVFKSVKYGWKDKGMPEWQHNMSARQIAGVTSYIMNLKGKKVEGGKAPQGELFVDEGGQPANAPAQTIPPEKEKVPVAESRVADEKGTRVKKG